jgi:NDP-sugar pyrophosphorylase family protein
VAPEPECFILAGGLGTRMRPFTENMPKALVPVAGKPFAHHQLSWLAGHGVRRVVYSIGYRGDQLRRYVGDGRAWGLEVDYVDEGPDLLGTGGALRLAYDRGALADEFLVTYGDSYLPVDVPAIWRHFRETSAEVLMTVLENAGRWDTSNVVFEDGRLIYDKTGQARWGDRMRFIDYGLLAMRRSVAAGIPSGPVDLADVLRDLSADNRVVGYEVEERFYEVGSPEGVRDLEAYLAAPSPSSER